MAGLGHIPYWLRVVFVAGVLLPTAAPAQLIPTTAAPAQTGYYLTPSLSVAEVYDDNVFYTTSPRTHDFLTRISPGLKAAYQSAPLTVEGSYTFDSEIYSQQQELTTAQMRQRGSIELKATPDQVLTLSVAGAYYQTRTPQELNLTTGLAARRVLAERYTASPGFTYRFDPLTTFTLRGGPRLTEGTIDRLPEALASIRHTMKNGELSLSYASTLTTVIGQAAAAMAQSITGKATTELLPKLVLSVGPAIYRVSSDAFKATVYSVILEASHQL